MSINWAELWTNVIPWDDLKAKSQLSRNLQIPTDILPTLAILSGLSENGAKLVSLTGAGAIRVAETGAGFTHVEVHEGSIENGMVQINFANLISSMVVNIDAFQCTIAHSEDGQIFDTPFTVLAGEKPSMDLLTRALQVTNTSVTTATGYRVWGLYYD